MDFVFIINCFQTRKMSSTNTVNLSSLNEWKDYITSLDAKLRNLASDLNWDYDQLTNADHEESVICSYDRGHRVPPSSLAEHEEKCKWKKEGYSENDKPLSECFSSESTCVKLQLTAELQAKILADSGSNSLGSDQLRAVPKTVERQQQEFTREERLTLYDYVVANTNAEKELSNFGLVDLEEKEKQKERKMTDLEIAIHARDAKRRRASYKNKVHTNRKTQTEVLREVIESQMAFFKDASSEKDSEEVGRTNEEKDEQQPSCSSAHHYQRGYDKQRNRDYDYGRQRNWSKSYDQQRNKDNYYEKQHKRDDMCDRQRNRDDSYGRQRNRDESRSHNRSKPYKNEYHHSEHRKSVAEEVSKQYSRHHHFSDRSSNSKEHGSDHHSKKKRKH